MTEAETEDIIAKEKSVNTAATEETEVIGEIEATGVIGMDTGRAGTTVIAATGTGTDPDTGTAGIGIGTVTGTVTGIAIGEDTTDLPDGEERMIMDTTPCLLREGRDTRMNRSLSL